MTNQEIVRKADLAVADLTTDGGVVQTEQAARFVRRVIQEPTLIREARVVEMRSPTREINKLFFNKRVLRAATSATALSTAAEDAQTAFDPVNEATRRAKPVTEKVTLTSSEVIAEIRLPYDVIEDNIEAGAIGAMTDTGGSPAGGGIIDTILAQLAERIALDFEELALTGDTTLGAADPYLDLQDGYLRDIGVNGNSFDQLNATVTKSLFKGGKKTMPNEFLRDLPRMRHYISFDNETEYRDTVADRATAAGDATLSGLAPLFAFGSPVVPVSLMPEDQGLFVNPQNLVWGIQRRMTMEFDKDISARVFIIVVTARVAVKVEEALAGVKYVNIGS